MKSIFIASFLFALVTSLTCPTEQLYIKIQKYSGPSGEKETYTIYGVINGEKTAVLEGLAAESYSSKTVEECIAISTDLLYTVELHHSENQSWHSLSLLTIENEDGVVLFNGNQVDSITSYDFSFNYILTPGSPVYKKETLDMGEWWSSNYEMDSQWSLTPMNGFEVSGTIITRYNFDAPDLDKYSHIVIRLFYKDGVALWVNDMQITFDNVNGDGQIAMWYPAQSQHEDYIWRDVAIPASMLKKENNLVVVSFHYISWDPIQTQVKYSILPIYASNPQTQSSPVSLSVRTTQGLEAGENSAYLVDRDPSTSASFSGQSTFFIAQASSLVYLRDYSVYRSGSNAVSQWALYSCRMGDYPCTNWAIISQSSLTQSYPGEFPVHVTSDQNMASNCFRMGLQSAVGSSNSIRLHEFAIQLSGIEMDLAMYPAQVVILAETVEIQPQTFQGEAIFSITPALPASLSLDPATGVITGQGTGHFYKQWNVFTVLRTIDNEKRRFSLILVDENPIPTEAPQSDPTAAPSTQPTQSPSGGSTDKAWIWWTVGVVVIVVIIIVVVFVIVYRKKTLPTQRGKAPAAHI